jgi:UDP:flavonoid glycosyltransferase YjiC (YdhE family)
VFARAAADAGIELKSTWSAEDFERVVADPELWDPRRGPAVVFTSIVAQLRSSYATLAAACDPSETVLVGHPLCFYARMFEEVHDVAAVTVDLAPSTLRSVYGPAALPAVDLSAWPTWTRRLLWWALDRFAIDPLIAPALNAWRAELGLLPVARVFETWMHSPQQIIGLFPDWFGLPQRDWPRRVSLVGFALIDAGGPLAPDLERFLQAGEPPIVFTPGSANRHAARFFETAAAATARLGRRALFVTSYREHLPQPLPAHVHHATYTSFTALFPRAAAVVHHGGVGTSAQALAAGAPQLVMPIGFDQPDNAIRLQKLGVAQAIAPARFTPEAVAPALDRLLTSGPVREACRRWRGRVDSAASTRAACDLIEQRYSAHRRVH